MYGISADLQKHKLPRKTLPGSAFLNHLLRGCWKADAISLIWNLLHLGMGLWIKCPDGNLPPVPPPTDGDSVGVFCSSFPSCFGPAVSVGWVCSSMTSFIRVDPVTFLSACMKTAWLVKHQHSVFWLTHDFISSIPWATWQYGPFHIQNCFLRYNAISIT